MGSASPSFASLSWNSPSQASNHHGPSYEAISLDVHIRDGADHGPTNTNTSTNNNTIMKFNQIALMTRAQEFL